MELLVDSIWGVNLPTTFALRYPDLMLNDEDHQILLRGPSDPHYWEAWDACLRDCHWFDTRIGKDSFLWLSDNGDLFAVTHDDMEQIESEEKLEVTND